MSAQTPPRAPRLVCGLLVDGALVPPRPGSAKLSNLERIPFQIELSASGLDLEPMTVAGSVGSSEPPTVEITAREVRDATRTEAPVRFVQMGAGKDVGRQYVSLSLEIPVDDAERRKGIKEYLDRLAAAAKKEGRSEEFAHLAQGEDASIAAFEHLYVQNRVGRFEVVCKYSSRKQGSWNGEVQAPPVPIEIVDRGKFFDQPQFGPQGGK